MDNVIHLWDFHPTKIYVLLEDGYREKFFNTTISIFSKTSDKGPSAQELAEYLNIRAKNYNLRTKYNYSSIYPWRRGWQWRKERNKIAEPRYTPLWVILEISKLICSNIPASKMFDYSELEKHVMSYRSKAGKILTNIKLPVKITPELMSIPIHVMCDGSYVEGKQPKYVQDKSVLCDLFIEKLRNCFGEFEVPKKSYLQGAVHFPAAIMHILSYYFKISSFLGSKVRIPLQIKNMGWKYKLAVSCAFILDEGTIGPDGRIAIYSSTKNFLRDLREILLKSEKGKLGYKCFDIKFEKSMNVYSLHISAKDANKLLREVKELKKEYTTCTLGPDKENNLEFIVKIQNRKWYNRPAGITKGFVLKELTKNPQTAVSLSLGMGISVSSIRSHLLELEKLGKIKRLYKNRKGILWGLYFLNELETVESRIYNYLRSKQKTLATSEISRKLNLNKSTVNYQLKKLERMNKVKRKYEIVDNIKIVLWSVQ